MQRLPHTHSCFVCGESNSIGLRLRFETDGRLVKTRFVPRPEHSGFREITHGGLLATVLDEVMVWAIAVQTRQFAFAAELTLRFARPAVSDKAMTASAELTANRKNRVFEARGELRSERDELLASATGKYLPVPAEQLGKLRADLAGDWTSFRDLVGLAG